VITCMFVYSEPKFSWKYIIMTTSCVFFVAEKMVKIGLQLKALLENVTGIEAEGEDFRWELYTVQPLLRQLIRSRSG
jgi:hypothetical protein